jgi:RNA polymerase sigma-70 factor (ECF subfamily)
MPAHAPSQLTPGTARRTADAVRLAPAPGLSDGDLARRIGRGDRWAEEAFYRRHLPAVHGMVRRLLATSHDADDVVQDAFATAFEIWDQLREPDRAAHWLMQIAIRKVHRRFRKKRLLKALGLDATVEDSTLALLARDDSPAGETRAELAILDRVLRELPVAERIAWMLRHVEGLALDEVAARCDCSLATAKRRIARAHARVSKHLAIREVAQ